MRRLSKEEIEKMVQEADRFQQHDNEKYEKVQAKNSLENTIYGTRNSVSEMQNVSEEDKSEIEKAIEEGTTWLDEHQDTSKEEYEKTGKELSQKFMSRIEEIKSKKLQDDLNTEETIFQWKNFNHKTSEFLVVSMELNVSTGFYIRRFCHDFGKFINSSAIAFDITRTKIEL